MIVNSIQPQSIRGLRVAPLVSASIRQQPKPLHGRKPQRRWPRKTAGRLTPPLDRRTIDPDHPGYPRVIGKQYFCPRPLARAFF